MIYVCDFLGRGLIWGLQKTAALVWLCLLKSGRQMGSVYQHQSKSLVTYSRLLRRVGTHPVVHVDAGFTLLEMLFALVIAGLGIAALIESSSIGLSATHTAVRYLEASARARSHLEAAAHGGWLVPGETEGDDRGGFHWRLRVAPASTTALRQGGFARLYSISVWISWRDGVTTREVRLDTEQIGYREG
jgi:prepilin-type N-terminal cleavage/methylation domain-containing protein